VNVFKRIREHRISRYAGRFSTIVIALLGAALVVLVTVDLGPWVKSLAERRGSQYLDRELTIGSLKIHLFQGRIVVQDLRIGGLHRGDRPFFTAKSLSLTLDWLPAFALRPNFTVSSVEMTDWQMLVEKWETQHSFPRFTRNNPSSGPRPFTTTMKFLRAYRGHFSYEDHELPWAVICRDLEINIGNLPNYHGTATFTGGTVTIQDYLPMAASMKAQFTLDGPLINLSRIDLETDGAVSVVSGVVDGAHWPEQTYHVESRVRFPRMREIFFKNEPWPLTGDGNFKGTFHLFNGGRDLSGSFASDELGVYDYRFPSLRGALHWTPKAFDVTDGGAKFYGGDAKFAYSIQPLGSKTKPTSRFEFDVAGADLQQLSDFQQLRGTRFAGSANWHNLLEWPLGRFAERRGEGRLTVSPPAGIVPMSPTLTAVDAADSRHDRYEWGPFAPLPLPSHLPIAGDITYSYGPDDVTFEPSRFVTERTHVTFQGTTAYGDRSQLSFHVTSRDWQESDQLLAGLMTDFGAKTGPVTFGGRGEFDGVMTGAFRKPLVEGEFRGEDLRGFDAVWGSATGQIAVENSYVTVKDAIVRAGDSEIRVDGRFSLGYPRDDGGEEIDARFRVSRRDLDSLRHAFAIDEYPVTGRLSGDFHLTGAYERPIGFGAMTIDDGTAYSEPFQKATATLRFDGKGVRLDNIALTKGTGTITGLAYVGWDSTYAFNADGRRLPLDQVNLVQYPAAPLTGVAEFTATGNGTFDVPRNDIRFRLIDAAMAKEALGQVTGNLALRGTELSGNLDAASPRLALTAAGRIALNRQRDAEITVRFHDSFLDPYVRMFEPRLSEYTTALVSGSIRIVGELADIDHLLVDGTVDSVDMRLFDYAVRNASPVRLSLDHNEIKVEDLQLVGVDTQLRVSGSINLNEEKIALRAAGEANLGVLQGFFKDVRGSGRARLTAAIDGPLRQPVFSGNAAIVDGRVRLFTLPNALDDINGTVQFDSAGIRLDDVAATFGGGKVQFGGRIGFDGYLPSELNVTARGQDMNLRVPEGVRSVVDADLSVTGPFAAPTLGGTVTVKNALWNRRIDTPGSIFDLASRRSASAAEAAPPAAASIPLKFDLQLHVPSTLRMENNVARMVANADLTLRGTYDRPAVFGHAEIERGEVTFEGRRYRITRGSMDFTNPNRIEPFFDVEAETNVRVPGQTYRVTISMAGTSEGLRPALNSDPPLPAADVLTLLLGDVRPNAATGTAPELRAIQDRTQTQTDILRTRATQALASPISEPVGKVVEQAFGVNTFQLTPSFVDPNSTQASRINPTARVTIGKRISDRVYLTFSRSLGTNIDQIVLLEIDQSDRVSWILSRNTEDQQTYALEFRVRRVF
jgi:TamB, inner membrane protein subunit of TAM complex